MSNEKTTIGLERKTPLAPKVDAKEALSGEKRPTKIVALSIDEDDDFGSDPYNHTGSFCVPDFDD